MTIYAIGDIQGCYQSLVALLSQINFKPRQDQLWLVGDLVNRGPDSLAVLRYLSDLPIPPVIVLGNHDLHLLAAASQQVPLEVGDTLDGVLAAPDCNDLCHWLRQQKLFHHDAELSYSMVHAGLLPEWDLATALACANEIEQILQSSEYDNFFQHMYGDTPAKWNPNLTGIERQRLIVNAFTRMRYCTPDGALQLTEKNSPEYSKLIPWFKMPNRKNQNLNIIFGHWAALEGKTDESNLFALDTGCVWGKQLMAFRLNDQQRFCVNCSAVS